MTPQDARKLLGGYAAGNLTPAEKEALFSAALDDQELFEALAAEEPLREALADAPVRAELHELLAPREPAWRRWFGRPQPWIPALAGLAAIVLVAVGVRQLTQEPEPRQVAMVRAPEAEPAKPPVEAPAPAAAPAAAKKTAPVPARKPVPAEAVAGGVPAGLPDSAIADKAAAGQVTVDPSPGGVIGGIVGGAPSAAAPPPPPPAPKIADASAGTFSLRDTERSRPRMAMARESVLLPVFVRVLRRTGDGAYVTAAEFASGDRLRFEVAVTRTGSLNVYRRDAAGNWIAVATSIAVEPGRRIVIPAEPVELPATTRFRFELTSPDAAPHNHEILIEPK